MSFDHLKETWSTLGEVDPLWAILTNPDKENGRWDLEAFFSTGRAEITHLLQEIHYLGFPLQTETTLDFGCGVGRLTQALCPHFAAVHGVDIAETMIAQANRYNQFADRCHYHVNQASSLELFADNSFDFIYSRIVLQHIPPIYSKQYIAEFVRVLRPGGLLVFQLPAELGKTGVDPSLAAYLVPSCFFSAQITTADKTITLKTGETKQLNVRVKNTSRVMWTAVQAHNENVILQLGYHWLTKNGDVHLYDSPRTPLTVDLQPGAETEMLLTVTAPETAGSYWLELDMVWEGVAWFYDRGSSTTFLSTKVWGDSVYTRSLRSQLSKLRDKIFPARSPESETTPHIGKPAFDMYGIAEVEVSNIIQENQGQMVAIQKEFSAGRNWPGYYYFVTKPHPKGSDK